MDIPSHVPLSTRSFIGWTGLSTPGLLSFQEASDPLSQATLPEI